MAETSYFWDGLVTGDANIAQYSAIEFTRVYSKLVGSDGAGFVTPAYNNGLNVQASSPLAASVAIATGSAFVKGFFYENDALLTLAIAANGSGNPRLDRIVLRVDFAAQTVRLAVLQGTPGAVPALPALTQTYGTTWEVSLAYVWVASGFATITMGEIHDERSFAPTFAGILASDLFTPNYAVNSEFMAYSDLQTAPPTQAPEGWSIFGTIPTIVASTKPAQMSRGRALQMTAGGANRGLAQTFNVLPSTPYALRFLINITAGDVGEIQVTTNSGTPGTITRTIRRTGAWLEETIYYTTESDATTLTFREYCVNNTDVIQIGQVLAQEGYYPGPWREIHETIFFDNSISDANWNNDAKSDGTTTISLSSDFGGFILAGTRAVWLTLLGNDSGSAALTLNYMAIRNTGGSAGSYNGPSVDVAGLPNDRIHSAAGWIRLNSSRQFNIEVDASGAGTFDAFIRIGGIQI